MRFLRYETEGGPRTALLRDGAAIELVGAAEPLAAAFAAGGDAVAALAAAATGPERDPASLAWLPPLPAPGKVICLGLNFAAHASETRMEKPGYPVLFTRYPSSYVGHERPILRPAVSEDFDYEAELVAVIGRRARGVPRARALDYVAGYSIFNDGSVRDYQFKSHQWMQGKNFDASGAFGPVFVTADELPPGAAGLRIAARLNGETLQDARTDEMLFDVAETVQILSEVMTLDPGDVLVMGTPEGVGFARDPKVFMKPGDRVEIEIEGIGVLANPVAQA